MGSGILGEPRDSHILFCCFLQLRFTVIGYSIPKGKQGGPNADLAMQTPNGRYWGIVRS